MVRHKSVPARKFYRVKEGKLERVGKLCLRCGDTWMAEHNDRWFCGKCKLTVWKEKS